MTPRNPDPPPGAGTVAIVGLGLMGGSLARALKALPEPPRVLAVETDPVQAALALDAGVVDRFEPSGPGLLSDADVVVYAVPLGVTLRLLAEHREAWAERALITDLAGMKAPVVELAVRQGFGDRFVGAHPFCGAEGSGFRAGREGLYAGATVFLACDDAVPPESRRRAEAFWTAVGGRPRWVDPVEHDRRMAWVSHLPQLVASALAGALDAAGWGPADLGPGGRDMTRLADASPEVWKPLLEASAGPTGAGLTSVSRALNALADLLARRDLDHIADFLARTREWTRREAGSANGTGRPVGGEPS